MVHVAPGRPCKTIANLYRRRYWRRRRPVTWGGGGGLAACGPHISRIFSPPCLGAAGETPAEPPSIPTSLIFDPCPPAERGTTKGKTDSSSCSLTTGLPSPLALLRSATPGRANSWVTRTAACHPDAWREEVSGRIGEPCDRARQASLGGRKVGGARGFIGPRVSGTWGRQAARDDCPWCLGRCCQRGRSSSLPPIRIRGIGCFGPDFRLPACSARCHVFVASAGIGFS
ncbi:hypothetical protein BHE74_00042948 [Ensete ventricosum]|nr:hypothetical protein BHE74_00042948 [Ensete ventricosum]